MAIPMKDRDDPFFSPEAIAKRKARAGKSGSFGGEPEKREEPYFGGGGGGRRIGKKAVDTAKGIPALVTRDNRTLTTFLIASFVVLAASQLAEGEIPAPGSFVPVMVVFLVLGFAAEFSPQTNRVATAFGGLVLLAIFFANGPGLVKALEGIAPDLESTAPTEETSPEPPITRTPGPRPDRQVRR